MDFSLQKPALNFALLLVVYPSVFLDDTSVTDGILATLSDRDSFSPFAKYVLTPSHDTDIFPHRLLSRPGVDSFTCDKAGFLLSALIA